MKKKAIKDSLQRTVALTVGSAGSRIVADKLPVKNMHLKRGGLVLLGAVGAALLDRSTTGKAIVQDLALGTAATQAGYWIKEAVGENMKDNALVSTALGTPIGDYDNPVEFRMGYADFSAASTIDTDFEDVTGVTFEM
ncbi:hypothetical protein [Tenacibaculum sp. 190130A14a]|uniref:Uncharacterized protein n=1 Tax=Tenacibaculum polynesiense TaxID=3137857 RepID=A0ABM9PG68_9FLAO